MTADPTLIASQPLPGEPAAAPAAAGIAGADTAVTNGYVFTRDWMTSKIPTWNELISQLQPVRMLEIGSFEGRSACYLIERCAPEREIELHCIDRWENPDDNPTVADTTADPLHEIEKRFDHNVGVALNLVGGRARVVKHKADSKVVLPAMLANGAAGAFDLIYVDGSHYAPDVMIDAVLAFQLLRVGGLLIFDDYLWVANDEGRSNPLLTPKPAIDAFVNTFQPHLKVITATPLYQLYVQKIGALA